ncbi:MAG: methyl-accepting chemotaxis protein [Lacrimispora sp.]|jgi:methyl-accepting chemotaxis protein|nr:methyl-accepting chemotaxis protein [Lacrimispora sp.]
MKTIKSKLFFVIFLLLFATSAVNVITGISASYYSIIENTKSDMNAMGEIANTALAAEISVLKEQTQSLASQLGTVQSGDMGKKLSVLDTAMKSTKFKALAIAGSDGKLFSTDQTLNGQDFSSKSFFSDSLQGKTTISSTEALDKQMVFYVCSPLPSQSGVVIGVLDSLYFSHIIENIVIGKTGNVFMLDNTGTFVANKRANLVEERQNFIEKAKTDPSLVNASKVYGKMIKGEKGVDKYEYETGARICAYGPVSNSDGWSYGVVAPVKEMTSSIIYTIVLLLISSGVLIIIGIIASVTLANGLSNPIKKITGRMELLADGDLESEVYIHNSKDEIGILTRSIADMISSLKSYIQEIAYILQQVSVGNLSVSSEIEYKGEFTEIQTSLNQITDQLNKAFGEIIVSARQVNSNSEQVAESSQQLSQGATRQASSVEEIAATISDISRHISSNAENAEKAGTKSLQAVDQVSSGQQEMNKLVTAMNGISETSAEIGKIIKVVEDIAFQTNILALNAAVEAARVGEAGKGFAVVADEVRNLAGKSADAARDTAALIQKSIEAVKNGNEIAIETSYSLEQIVNSTREVSTLINQISNSSLEQSEAVSQLKIGIEQVSGVVQSNAATAEESAAYAQELSGQSLIMTKLVSKFELNKGNK